MSASARTSTFTGPTPHFFSKNNSGKWDKTSTSFLFCLLRFKFSLCFGGKKSSKKREQINTEKKTMKLYVWNNGHLASSFPYCGRYFILWQVVKACCHRVLSFQKIKIFVVLKIFFVHPKLFPSVPWGVADTLELHSFRDLEGLSRDETSQPGQPGSWGSSFRLPFQTHLPSPSPPSDQPTHWSLSML